VRASLFVRMPFCTRAFGFKAASAPPPARRRWAKRITAAAFCRRAFGFRSRRLPSSAPEPVFGRLIHRGFRTRLPRLPVGHVSAGAVTLAMRRKLMVFICSLPIVRQVPCVVFINERLLRFVWSSAGEPDTQELDLEEFAQAQVEQLAWFMLKPQELINMGFTRKVVAK